MVWFGSRVVHPMRNERNCNGVDQFHDIVARMTLELMVSDIDQYLARVSLLLKEVTHCNESSIVSEDAFLRHGMMDFYDRDKRDSKKAPQEERGRLLDR